MNNNNLKERESITYVLAGGGTITLLVGDSVRVVGDVAKRHLGLPDERCPYTLAGFNYDGEDIQSINFLTSYAYCHKAITLKPEDFGVKFFIELPTQKQSTAGMTYHKSIAKVFVKNGDENNE